MKTVEETMRQGIKYIVTKSSKDKTFIKGDRILLAKDGVILCFNLGAWLDKEYCQMALDGVELHSDRRKFNYTAVCPERRKNK